ncbi:MAG: retroviral-like aspartic protease family protein [Verrucomicrobia bacterium]|nr:retroviral-like aspartic protease family protein [Verrucomicrobiota bacterium]
MILTFPRVLALATLLAGSTLAQTVPDGEYRDFKGSNGVVIQAVLLDKTPSEAVLLLRTGKRSTIPLNRLSAEDQAYVAAWSKDKAVFVQKCRGLAIRQLLELRGYESFEFRLENNSILIDGKLNGKPARFLVDTGAGTSLLHAPFATSVGLEVGPMTEKIYGVSGEAPAGWTPVPSIQLGEAVFKDRRILATDLLKDRPPGARSREDTILGADFMNKLDAVISYQDRRIFLRPDRSDQSEIKPSGGEDSLAFRLFKTKEGKTLRGKVVAKTPTSVTIELVDGKKSIIFISNFVPEDEAYLKAWSEAGAFFLQHCQSLTIHELLTLRKYQSFQFERRGNHIFVNGTLNDNKVTYMIDTGADSSLLHVNAAKKYGCEVGPMTETVWGIGGKAPAGVTNIVKLTMGEAVLTNRKVLATDMHRGDDDDNMDYVGLFGADFMRELDAVITYTENRIFLIQR